MTLLIACPRTIPSEVVDEEFSLSYHQRVGKAQGFLSPIERNAGDANICMSLALVAPLHTVSHVLLNGQPAIAST